MSRTVLERSDDYTIERDDESGVAIFTYTQYVSGEQLREVLDEWAAVIEATDVDRYVVNAEAFMAHPEEDKRWIAETWVPRLIDQGVRLGAGVHADSAVARLDMEEIERMVNEVDSDFTYRTFEAESDALEWLAER